MPQLQSGAANRVLSSHDLPWRNNQALHLHSPPYYTIHGTRMCECGNKKKDGKRDRIYLSDGSNRRRGSAFPIPLHLPRFLSAISYIRDLPNSA